MDLAAVDSANPRMGWEVCNNNLNLTNIVYFIGFSRLAGVTSSSWSTTNNTDNLKPEKSQDTKENLKTEDFRTGEEDEKNVLEVTTAKLFKVCKVHISDLFI